MTFSTPAYEGDLRVRSEDRAGDNSDAKNLLSQEAQKLADRSTTEETLEVALIAGQEFRAPDKWKQAADENAVLIKDAIDTINKKDKDNPKAPSDFSDDPRLVFAAISLAEWMRSIGMRDGNTPLDTKLQDRNRQEFLKLVNAALAGCKPPMKIEYNWKDKDGDNYQELVLLPVKGPRPENPAKMTLRLVPDDKDENKWNNVTHWGKFRRAARDFGSEIGVANLGSDGGKVPDDTIKLLQANLNVDLFKMYGDADTKNGKVTLDTMQLHYLAHHANLHMKKSGYSLKYDSGKGEFHICYGTKVVGTLKAEGTCEKKE